MMKNFSAVTLARFSFIGLIVLALTVTLPAQVQNGQYQGTVLDQSGAAVPNATVTATEQGTGQSFKATTSQTGFYVIPQLPVGQYTVKVESSGFKSESAKNQTVNAGVISRLDFKLAVGQVTETVEVTDVAVAVNTEDAKLANTVGATQIQNLPLNGRNVYDLIQLNTGAVNVKGIMSENGAGTVVNGVREDFNGFTVNGVSNKGLSGGNVNQPIEDTVQEFQQLSLNLSAQYGNSAGSITNLVTKSGTNSFHGSIFEFIRNDVLDANFFFNNQAGLKKQPLRFNQFGGTIGGPIIKDKFFFFGSYQGDRFTTSSTPSPVAVESPQWRAAVAAGQPNSVAALLYNSFAPQVQGTCNAADDLNSYIAGGSSGSGFASVADYLNPVSYTDLGATATDAANIVARLTPIIGPGGTFSSTGVPFTCSTVSIFKQQVNTPLGNLFNGNEGELRLDYNMSDRNRFFTEFNWQRQTDTFGPGLPQSARGFLNPVKNTFPNFQFNFIHTFSPRILNEFRAGYTANVTLTKTNLPGVPDLEFDDGSMGFGSYNGYPQFFKENIYTYSDVVSISHGSHNIKVGADIRRNIENSEFDVSRPSYYFFDPLLFAADSPYTVAAGVDPGFVASHASQNATGRANLATNIRHWRNVEFGTFFQDDWKITRRLTLNLGLRYDLFKRHNEENDLATTFIKGPGTSVIDNITTGAGWLKDANLQLGAPGCDPATITPNAQAVILANSPCGTGGFAAAKSLGKGDHNDFGPRIGFAWDIFGDGKTSLRMGYGASYEGTLYNPLSNSRWNPPYYSFNSASNGLIGDVNTVIYGPQSGGAPRFTGPPDPANGQGPGANSVGNIGGWFAGNPDQAILTGIVLPEGIRDPYVHNFFASLQHQLVPKVVLQVDYVGTAGHKLFRAEDINRIPGGKLPLDAAGNPVCVTDNFGRRICSEFTDFGNGFGNANGRLNGNYGRLRNWLNVANSNYNALQTSLKTQSWHNVTFNLAYTFSHSIDNGSTWHSGATSANQAGAGEGFTTDQTQPFLDRGNSIYDVRHRLVVNYVYELPWFTHSSNAFARNVLGGWQWNAIWSYQTGAHWEPWCSTSSRARLNAAGQVTNTRCDFNLDAGNNDRPDAQASNVDVTHDMWANGWDPVNGTFNLSGNGLPGSGSTFFTRPCAGCVGSEGRNTFIGPNFFGTDMSLFKNFHVTERVNVQFRAESFNLFNRTNFELPGANSNANGKVTTGTFGQAGGTFFPRELQFGLKISF